jgi:ABC-type branched-subunit amino acid transport system substrate-binding protein
MVLYSKMNKMVLIGLFLLVFLAGCTSQNIEVNDKNKSFEIGFVGPFSGPVSYFGAVMSTGLAIARTKELPLKIIFESSDCNGKKAVSAVHKLLAVDGVKYVVGPMCNEAVLATKSLFEEYGALSFTIGLPSSEIANFTTNHISLAPEIKHVVARVADDMLDKGYTKIAVLHIAGPFQDENYNTFKAYYEELGGEIVEDHTFSPSETDFRSSITQIENSDVDAVFLVAHTTNLANMLDQLVEFDVQLPKYSIHAAQTGSTLTPSANGLLYPFPSSAAENPQQIFFAKQYYEETGEDVDYVAANVYDSLMILSAGIELCGYEDVDCVKSYIYSLKDYDGANGLLTVGDTGVGLYKEVQLKQVVNETFIRVK